MVVKTRKFVSLWFALAMPVTFWDAGFCLLRPRSMVGGDLHWLWKPYALYQEVDHAYSMQAFQDGYGFTGAIGVMAVAENCVALAYLYLAHVAHSPVAPLVGFTSALMTLSKTAVYILQEIYCGGCAVGHNDIQTIIAYFAFPNVLWLLASTYVIWRLGKDMHSALCAANADIYGYSAIQRTNAVKGPDRRQ